MASSSSKSGNPGGNVRTAKPRTPNGAIGGLLGALIMSVVAGVLVTVAVTPVVAVGGMTATSAIKLFQDLPSHLDPGQLAQPSTIWAKNSDGDNVKLAEFFVQNREMVGWDGISQYVKDAAVATEDPRFFTHGGVDVIGLGRATLGELTGVDAGGASTITMQYVRNVLVQRAEAIIDEDEREAAFEDAMRQEYDRKLQEMRYAISIEKRFSKNDILVGYLNIALFGGNVYGIESAAQTYFSKSAKDLSLPEAASLVAMVQEPNALNLHDPDNIEANETRRNYVLKRMFDAGRITQQQFDDAVATPVEPVLSTRQTGCTLAETNYGAGHFCDYAKRYFELDPRLGNSPEERHFNLLRGGYDIYTTLDLDLQQSLVAGIRENVPSTMDFMKIGAAASTVQPGTGRVLAMAQNQPFNDDPDFTDSNPGYTAINYNTDYEYGGSSGFHIGSTSKAFTLAEWLRSGNSLYDSVNGNARSQSNFVFPASCMEGGSYHTGPWRFQNDAGERPGNTSVMNGTSQSLNGVFVSMQEKLDLCDTIGLAQKLGLHRASDQPHYTQEDVDAGDATPEQVGKPTRPTLNEDLRDLSLVPSFTFAGTDEIAPLSVASAYASFAANGKACSPVPIDKITDADGNEQPFTGSNCTEALSADVAAGVLFALNGVVQGGTGSHAYSPYGVPRFIKTGTTDETFDRWNAGGTTKAVTAVWTGNIGPMVSSDGDAYKVSLNSSGLGRPERLIFNSVMNAADEKYGGDAFPDPPRSATQRVVVAVPDVRGLSYEAAERALTAAGFSVADGGEVDSALSQGLIVRSDPSGEASRGANITIYRSRGNMRLIPDGIVGVSASSARSQLVNAGFTNVDLRCSSGTGPANDAHTVESVSPSPGTETNPSSRVVLSLKCS